MESVVFLESLAFLTKMESKVWPPKMVSLAAKSLLSDFKLSVEVPDKGPILLRKGKGGDPALFSCDLSIMERRKASPSSGSTNLSFSEEKNSGSASTTPRCQDHQSEELQDADKDPQLVVRIDECEIYRIDMSQIAKVELVKGSKSPNHPASIAVTFPTCLFRFFSMKPSDRLSAVNVALAKLPRVSPMPRYLSISPEQAEEATKRKIQALDEGWKATVDTFLHKQPPILSTDQVCKVLNDAASSVTYLSTAEADQADLGHQNRLTKIDDAMEEIMNAYFPSAKQRRLTTNNPRPEGNVTLSMEDCIIKAKDLMQQKHAATRDRHKLTLIPIKD